MQSDLSNDNIDSDQYNSDDGSNKEKPQDQTSKSRRIMEFSAAGLVIVIGAIWLVGLIDKVVMPLVVGSGVERVVPDLHHLSVPAADSLCQSLNLELRVGSQTRIDDHLTPGTILDQNPLAGGIVKPGKRVEVVLSAASRLVACPSIVGKSVRDAKLLADAIGLQLPETNISYRHTSSYPDGAIVYQSPFAGDSIPPNSELKITMSLGPLPKEIFAPDLIGRNIDAIYVVLARSALRLGKVEKFPDRDAIPGTVLSQMPDPGTRMQRRDRVDVRVAIEPEDESKSDKDTSN